MDRDTQLALADSLTEVATRIEDQAIALRKQAAKLRHPQSLSAVPDESGS
jgi:hypothetical protein